MIAFRLAEDALDPHDLVHGAAGDRGRALERIAHPIGPAREAEAQPEDALAVDLGLAERAEARALLALGDRDRDAAARSAGLTDGAADLVARPARVGERTRGDVERRDQVEVHRRG